MRNNKNIVVLFKQNIAKNELHDDHVDDQVECNEEYHGERTRHSDKPYQIHKKDKNHVTTYQKKEKEKTLDNHTETSNPLATTCQLFSPSKTKQTTKLAGNESKFRL